MRKTLSLGLLSLLAVGAAALSGCSGSNSESSEGAVSSSSPNSQDGHEPVTLRFMHRWPESQAVFEQAIKEFEEKYPYITIDMMPTLSGDQYNAQLQAAVASNDLPDIFANSAAVPIDQLVQLGLIHDLDDVIPQEKRAEFYDGTWTEGFTTIGGKIYALPHFTPRRFAHVMYYNKDVLAKAGLTEADVPQSWDDLIKISDKIKAVGNDVYPLIIGVKTPWLMDGFIGQMATAIDPDILPNDGTYQGFNYKTGEYDFNSPGIVETVKFLKQLQDDKILHPNSLVIDYREASSMFAGGKAAFDIDGTFLTSELQENNKFDNFGVAPLPTKDGKPQYYAFQGETKASVHISQNTKHYEEAKLFLQFYMDRIYKLQLEKGVEGSPIIAQNESAKVDNPQFVRAQEIQDETFILSPHQYTRNPATVRVNTELNGKKPKENLGNVFEGYMVGQFRNLESILDRLSADYNTALKDSVNKVKNEGVDVSLDDFKFPNWTPFEPYTKDKYDELGQ